MIDDINDPQDVENVVFQLQDSTAMTLLGVTNQTNATVQFDSTQFITAPSNGQSRVQARTDATGMDSTLLTDLLITIPDGMFESIIFQAALTGNAPETMLTISAMDNMGNLFEETFTLSNSKFFTLTTDAFQSISSVRLTASSGLSDVRQVRIGGALAEPAAGIVPEPASLALMGLGGIGMFGGWYSKRRKSFAIAA